MMTKGEDGHFEPTVRAAKGGEIKFGQLLLMECRSREVKAQGSGASDTRRAFLKPEPSRAPWPLHLRAKAEGWSEKGDLANQDELHLAFYGDGLSYRFTKTIRHTEQQWQQLDDLVEQAIQHWNTIPTEQRDFDKAKVEFMRRFV